MKKLLTLIFCFVVATASVFSQGVAPKQESKINTLPAEQAKDLITGLNAENPYFPPLTGLANDMNASGATYSVYVPEGQYPWAPGVIILTPNGTTAKAFALSTTGRVWMTLADKYKFSLGIVEPENGAWNIDGKGGRDEVAAIVNVYTQMRSKSLKLNLPFTMDKSRVTLVGYEEGATAAIIAAAGESAAYAAVAAIDSVGSDEDYLNVLDASYCFPFPADGLKAKEEIKLPNGALQMPLWLIGGEDTVALDHFKNKNNTDSVGYTSDAVRYYDSTHTVGSLFVTKDRSAVNEEAVWTEFLSQYTRPLGVEGGHLANAMQFATRKDGTGYHLTEEMYGGFLRRYLTYIPTSYKEGEKVPMVMVCHGYTATMYALAEESRWCDIAEKNNIIVVFPQAYPNSISSMPNIPAPMWMSPNLFKGGEGYPDDVAFLSHVIDRTISTYAIDEGRVYGTGHSNGCAMILSLASEKPDLFTAIAPIGYPSAGTSDKKSTLPTWIIVGEYDGAGKEIAEGNKNDKAITYWTAFNGLDKANCNDTESEDGRFQTRTWKNASGAPLFKFTGVNRSAHSYFPAESEMIWTEFFSRYKKVGGKLYYDGTEVNDKGLKQIVTKIADNAWCVSEFNLVNSFLVEGKDKAALIDTCCGLGNIREVAEGLTDKPLIVLLTHGHGDHIGGIYHFSKDTPIYMSSLDDRIAKENPMKNAGRKWYVDSRGPVRFPGHQEEMVATIPTTEPDMHFNYIDIKDGDIIDLGGGVTLEVITTPGHTAGSVCYLDKQNRILFSGDTLNKSIILSRQPNNDTKLIKILNGTMQKIYKDYAYFDSLAVGHDAILSPRTVVENYLDITNGLLDGTLKGDYEEVAFRAGDVVRLGKAELWYQCDK